MTDLLNKSNRPAILQEIEQIHRLCPTQTKRSEVSLQLQQFSTPLPLGYIAKVAANITPDDLVLEPSAGTGILAAFALAGLDSFSTKSVPSGGESCMNSSQAFPYRLTMPSCKT
jgi:hypothetical protein